METLQISRKRYVKLLSHRYSSKQICIIVLLGTLVLLSLALGIWLAITRKDPSETVTISSLAQSLGNDNVRNSLENVISDLDIVKENAGKKSANISVDVFSVDAFSEGRFAQVNDFKARGPNRSIDGTELQAGAVVADQKTWVIYTIDEENNLNFTQNISFEVPVLVKGGTEFGGQFITRGNNDSLSMTTLTPRIETDASIYFNETTKILQIAPQGASESMVLRFINGTWTPTIENRVLYNFEGNSFSGIGLDNDDTFEFGTFSTVMNNISKVVVFVAEAIGGGVDNITFELWRNEDSSAPAPTVPFYSNVLGSIALSGEKINIVLEDPNLTFALAGLVGDVTVDIRLFCSNPGVSFRVDTLKIEERS